MHFSNGNAENIKIQINLESLGTKVLVVMKFPFEVKFHFQTGFSLLSWLVLLLLKNQQYFFFLICYIFWEKKECLSFANLHCNKPSSRGIINLFNICGQNTYVQ